MPFHTTQPVTTLGPLSFFGEMALLSRRERAIASVRVRTNCETYHLKRDAYERLVLNFPSFKDWVESVARLRLAVRRAALERLTHRRARAVPPPAHLARAQLEHGAGWPANSPSPSV